MGLNNFHSGARSLQSDAWFQTGYDVTDNGCSVAALPFDSLSLSQWSENVDRFRSREMKLARQDAHDGEHLIVERDRAANNFFNAAETPQPQAVGEDGNLIVTSLVFTPRKVSAEKRLDLQQRKQVRRRLYRAERNGVPIAVNRSLWLRQSRKSGVSVTSSVVLFLIDSPIHTSRSASG